MSKTGWSNATYYARIVSLCRAIDSFDRDAMRWMFRHRHDALTVLFRGITKTATGRTWVGVGVVLTLLQCFGVRVIVAQHLVLRALLCSLLAWLLGSLVKARVRRRRPYQALPDCPSLVSSPLDDSLPSGHAASSAAFVTALIIFGHPLWHYLLVWAPMVAVSRFYLGVHFPSDITAGIGLGIACGACACLMIIF